MITCTNCGADVTGKKFCSSCGTPVQATGQNASASATTTCPRCGAEVASNAAFCMHCGSALKSQAAQQPVYQQSQPLQQPQQPTYQQYSQYQDPSYQQQYQQPQYNQQSSYQQQPYQQYQQPQYDPSQYQQQGQYNQYNQGSYQQPQQPQQYGQPQYGQPYNPQYGQQYQQPQYDPSYGQYNQGGYQQQPMTLRCPVCMAMAPLGTPNCPSCHTSLAGVVPTPVNMQPQGQQGGLGGLFQGNNGKMAMGALGGAAAVLGGEMLLRGIEGNVENRVDGDMGYGYDDYERRRHHHHHREDEGLLGGLGDIANDLGL